MLQVKAASSGAELERLRAAALDMTQRLESTRRAADEKAAAYADALRAAAGAAAEASALRSVGGAQGE